MTQTIALEGIISCFVFHFHEDGLIFRLHELSHTSTTYKLMLSGGDIKGVQGDTGHAQASRVTERYAHILDDSRRMNAERFQQQFYSGPVSEEPAAQPDPIQQLDGGEKQTLLIKLLAESPEMVSVIKSLTQAI